ncbi:unnamed protein product [Lathyrus oleraceus]|uniref:Non-haem dioxygenase N-terminal domain-containing protein n=1 Tax=Pisum sativum TaxID=3888 RepID=A0A9D4Y6T0_PEA|nr:gibberellin 2-beta-dioxygenase 1 [Pisum sativum]KAI5434068.1 hypothetical protein KIW84_021074 [Pisum sativum]
MAFSTHEQQHQLLSNLHGGATSAPPPTPSNNTSNLLSSSDAADALSRLLHRLPPNLSLPNRRSPSSSTSPPSLSFSSLTPNELLSSVSKSGFVQLTDHSVSSKLANSAESESLKLFDLSRDQKESFFPQNWPLGYEGGDNDDDDGITESFRLALSCSTVSDELKLDSLNEFARALEKVGLNIIDVLTKGLGVVNPVEEDPTRFSSIMWISECLAGNKPGSRSGFYPFIIGLQYQIRCQKHSLLSDSSGWISVLPHVDSILVTVGDIAQVWSNGKLKKVRGRPMATLGDENDSRCITMSLLITLPTESNVAPLLPIGIKDKVEDADEEESDIGGEVQKKVFNNIDFEDYAWRVYHECLLFKDPLDRYRVTQ